MQANTVDLTITMPAAHPNTDANPQDNWQACVTEWAAAKERLEILVNEATAHRETISAIKKLSEEATLIRIKNSKTMENVRNIMQDVNQRLHDLVEREFLTGPCPDDDLRPLIGVIDVDRRRLLKDLERKIEEED